MRPAVSDPGALVRLAWHQQPTLLQMCQLLWPPPTELSVGRAATGRVSAKGGSPEDARHPGDMEYILVPGLRRPPLMVPAGQRVAGAAVRHYSGQRSPAARLATKVFSVCLDSGLGGAMFRRRLTMHVPAGTDTVETHLADLLHRDIRVGMYLGPPRANRKPVLHILTPAGQAVAFAKIGVSPLTRQLAHTERNALTLIKKTGLRGVTVPEVLHYGNWQGLDILVLSVLPAWQRRQALSAPQLVEAMTSVAAMDGMQSSPLRTSEYLVRLRERLSSAVESPDQATLLWLIDELNAQAGDEVLTYGAWHGDWTPWNMASTSDGIMVWDWERFTAGVPLGFDALHHRLQVEVGPGHRDPVAAAAACAQGAPALLAPFGVSAGQARVTALLYLADLATRYLSDQQAAAGARRGAPGSWLIPALKGEIIRI
jgi:Phosphotransferase enzyme family